MEDYCLYFAGRKPVLLNPWTLIGATTHAGEVPQPLRARFGIIEKLDYYTIPELALILQTTAQALGVNMDDSGAETIATCSRGTPRTANRLLRRVIDHVQARLPLQIRAGEASVALSRMGIDKLGLTVTDRELMLLILAKYKGGPVGLQALASELGEEEDMIAEIYEPYLMRIGFLYRTSRGRFATDAAREYFGVPVARK
jgi:Holliday junction DNA helicase RuvB